MHRRREFRKELYRSKTPRNKAKQKPKLDLERFRTRSYQKLQQFHLLDPERPNHRTLIDNKQKASRKPTRTHRIRKTLAFRARIITRPANLKSRCL